jgi:hypothetical protein
MKIFTNWRKKKKLKQTHEQIIQRVGALFILELTNNREFRRKIKSTNFGKELEKTIKY